MTTTGDAAALSGDALRERGVRRAAAAQAPKARRGRPSPARSEEITSLILREAERMFLGQGYEATSMEAVARSAAVPKTTLYKRFPDKNELLRSVISHRMKLRAAEGAMSRSVLPNTLAERLVHHLATILVGATQPDVRAFNRLATNLPETHGQEFSGRAFWGYQNMRALLIEAIVTLGPAAGIHARAADRVAETLMEMAVGWLVRRDTTAPAQPAEADEAARWFVNLAIEGSALW